MSIVLTRRKEVATAALLAAGGKMAYLQLSNNLALLYELSFMIR